MPLIPTNPPTPISEYAWRFTWTDSGGPYYVWFRGELAAVVNEAAFEVAEWEGHVPMIEVATSEDDKPEMVKHPEHVRLQWRHPAGGVALSHYLIQRLVSGDWETIDIVPYSPGKYHTWKSGRLADDTEYQHAIRPVLANGIQLDGTEHVTTIVRYPDPPAVSYAYAAGNVTVVAG